MAGEQQSWEAESDPTRLREGLLQDPYNVALRKRYLALRTPELREEDRGRVQTHRDAVRLVVPALLGGAVLGVLVWAVSWGIVASGLKADEHAVSLRERLVGILRMFATQFGLAVSVIAFSLTTGLFVWNTGLKEKQRGRLAAELGPLPDDAPDTLTEARQQFLEG